MRIGSVYILLNPSTPRLVKIGKTNREVQKRVSELSRHTGVPQEFINLYDQIVSDAESVERLLHDRFAEYRLSPNKEFFTVPPRKAILALQEIAANFPAPDLSKAEGSDLMPYPKRTFAEYLDPTVTAVRFIQLPSACFLEVTRQEKKGGPKIVSHDDVPLSGLVISERPQTVIHDLATNVEHLVRLDAYDWAMISDLFPRESVRRVTEKLERTDPPPT